MQIMPFEDAKTYRFNPFDLTKVWPHGDYPLIDVGKLTLNRNVTDYHTEIEQAAFQPNNVVPGTGLSPDKMLLARGFSYADAHRARLGVNYQQIPVNRPRVAGPQLLEGRGDAGRQRDRPGLLPQLRRGRAGGRHRRLRRARRVGGRRRDGAGRVHASTPRTTTTVQANTMVNQVLDDAARDRLVDNVAGHAAACSREDILASGVRVLAQHRQGHRRPDRGGDPREAQGGWRDEAPRLVVPHHRRSSQEARSRGGPGLRRCRPAPVKIEVWSDVVCPWCYVGSRHLAEALRRFPHADQVEVEWRSYELDPRAPAQRPGSYVERLSRKYGVPPGQARARLSRIIQVGADAGIEFRFDDARLGNTFDAHRLLHLARAHGRQEALKDRLFAAAFTEGRPIGDRETLVALAVEADLPEPDARRVLESDEHAADVRADEADALEVDVDGVPFFLVDRRFMIPGAQSPETMVTILERAWRKTHPTEDGAPASP